MPVSVLVYDDREGKPNLVGSLFFNASTRLRSGVSTTVTYDPAWLERAGSYPIDPALPIFGRSTTVPGLPGCFQDCSPDRWGRNLISKRLRAETLRAGDTQRTLTDVDYLVGVSDLTRQGALRLRASVDGPFVDPDTSVPKLLELPRLLAASDAVARDPDDQSAIGDLLDAGSGSLGGARPKASVRDGEQLMIAKFPHHDDRWDVMAWEATALDLAASCGIDVPGRRLTHLDGRSVLVLDRFDRTSAGHRLPYVSAMTLLGASDGIPSDYTDLCDAISDLGSATKADLAALWVRVALSVAIHNTDDHMRNHGFTRFPGGWTLAPLFDVNPERDIAKPRVSGIDGARTPDDETLGLASLAVECRLDWSQRNESAERVVSAVGEWESVARSKGISESEIASFAPAFEQGIAAVRSLLGLG